MPDAKDLRQRHTAKRLGATAAVRNNAAGLLQSDLAECELRPHLLMSMQQNSLSLAHSCGGILSLLPRCRQALEFIQFVLDVGGNFLVVVVNLLIGADCF